VVPARPAVPRGTQRGPRTLLDGRMLSTSLLAGVTCVPKSLRVEDSGPSKNRTSTCERKQTRPTWN